MLIPITDKSVLLLLLHLESRDGANTSISRDFFGSNLVSHALDRMRRGTHEDDPRLFARLRERSVFA